MVNGTTITSFSEPTNQFAIAVSGGTVRILDDVNPTYGSEYSLTGVPDGVTFPYFIPNYTDDGTTDGTHNFVSQWSSGNIYETNLDFSNPTLFFNAGSNTLGVTYDGLNNSLWVSSYGGSDNTVRDYSMTTHQLLSSFTTGSTSNVALSYDTADNTLWMLEGNTLVQYAVTGGPVLQSMNIGAQTSGALVFGGEFGETPGSPAVPEPASLFLLATGVLGLRKACRRVS